MDPHSFEALIAGLESSGMSRSDIAMHAGVSRDTVWRLATGQAKRPSFDTVSRIEKLLVLSETSDRVMRYVSR